MKNIGITVTPPKTECQDILCPFHGNLSVRTKTIKGKIVSAKMKQTVIVQRDYAQYVRKYMRYERRRSRIPAHNPSCIAAKEGDTVRIAECRPLSKTVSFVIVEKASKGET